MARKHIGKVRDSVDAWIDAKIDFAGDGDDPSQYGIYWHKGEPSGLRLYIGKRKVTWQYFRQSRDHGDRDHTFVTLGQYDRGRFFGVVRNPSPTAEPALHREPWHMSYSKACDAATVESAKIIRGEPTLNANETPTFAQAFDGGYELIEGKRRKPVKIEGYLQYLERQAREAGKPPRWADKVRSLGRCYMVPKWGKYRLSELADIPNEVAAWLTDDVKSATSANHIARVMRAMWRRIAKRDPRIKSDAYPTRAHEKKTERGQQKGMTVKQFAEWYEAVMALPTPVHRAYNLLNLLIGARPGELGRSVWGDNSPDAHTFTISDNAKMSNAIAVPTTPEIRAVLKMAHDANPDHKPTDLIFPGCVSNPDKNGFNDLPARGHALRRTYMTFAHNECRVPTQFSQWLMGQAPEGIKANYLLKWAMDNGEAIKEAQHKISRKMWAALTGKKVVRLAA